MPYTIMQQALVNILSTLNVIIPLGGINMHSCYTHNISARQYNTSTNDMFNSFLNQKLIVKLLKQISCYALLKFKVQSGQ